MEQPMRAPEGALSSPIFVKTYDFTKWLLERTIRFPKSQRFVMAKRIEEAALGFYDNLLRAAKDPGGRPKALAEADLDLERLRHYIRLCTDLGIFSPGQYEFSSVAVVELGRLLGGWMRKESTRGR